jgi:hypothetical protein
MLRPDQCKLGANFNWIGVVEFICGFSDKTNSIAEEGLVVASLATLIPSLSVTTWLCRIDAKLTVSRGRAVGR